MSEQEGDSTIKRQLLSFTYSNSFNHCAVRESIINNKIVGEEYSRYNNPEMWEHAIEYKKVRHLQKDLIKELTWELLKNTNEEVDKEILEMIEDIAVYF